jgi:hypothetical protein
VIAELVCGVYDCDGAPTSEPDRAIHRWFAPNAPLADFVRAPLTVKCATLAGVREFLASCAYVPDPEQHGVADHWLMPAELERTRRGDCEDLSLWAWRQLLALGYASRFVCGRGPSRRGHAWVTYRDGERVFLLEPLHARRFERFPRLAALAYRPVLSASWDGERLAYFFHAATGRRVPVAMLPGLAREWAQFKLGGFDGKLPA